MKIFGKHKKHPLSFYLFLVFVLVLILYTVSMFVYLKITGVYAIATIQEGTPTSEGIDYRYSFFYNGKRYSGSFTGLGGYANGDKYFVSFSQISPSKNLLQYNKPVPECLKDSIYSCWSVIPKCTH